MYTLNKAMLNRVSFRVGSYIFAYLSKFISTKYLLVGAHHCIPIK